MQLHERLQSLAQSFASDVLMAIRTAPLSDLIEMDESPVPRRASTGHVDVNVLAASVIARATDGRRVPVDETKGGKRSPARLARRSAAQIAKMVDSVVALLKEDWQGLRAEEIRDRLKLEAREMPRILKQGLSSKKLLILSGEKRATTYGAVGAKRLGAKVGKPTKSAKPTKVVKGAKAANGAKPAKVAKAAPKKAPKAAKPKTKPGLAKAPAESVAAAQ
jgi:hypothetical protein